MENVTQDHSTAGSYLFLIFGVPLHLLLLPQLFQGLHLGFGNLFPSLVEHKQTNHTSYTQPDPKLNQIYVLLKLIDVKQEVKTL